MSIRNTLRRKLSMPMAALIFCGVALLPMAACEDNDGPLEEVGEELDEAADDIEDAVDG